MSKFIFIFESDNILDSELKLVPIIENGVKFGDRLVQAPKIVQYTDGTNYPQYADSYKSCGAIKIYTNGRFSRDVVFSDGSTGRYWGYCSPSGSRAIELHGVVYCFSYGQYYPSNV